MYNRVLGENKLLKGDGWIYIDELNSLRSKRSFRDKGEINYHKKYDNSKYLECYGKKLQNYLYNVSMYYFPIGSRESKKSDGIMLLNRGLLFNREVFVDTHLEMVNSELNELWGEVIEKTNSDETKQRVKSYRRKIRMRNTYIYQTRLGFSKEWYELNPTNQGVIDWVREGVIEVNENGEFN